MLPQTRKEISQIGWIRLTDLPGYSKRKDKNAHPGIKLYMVTPFLSGLRKWISQNIHRKGKLLPVVPEDGEMVEEVFEPRASDELVSMLRNSQTANKGQVDLLGMLRNGANTADQQPSTNGSNLLAMLQKPNGAMVSSTAQPNQHGADNRAESLLRILKSPPPSEAQHPMTPVVQHKTAEEHVPTIQRHHHLPLGELETSTLPSGVPEATPTTAHQNALLAALKAHHPHPMTSQPPPSAPPHPPNPQLPHTAPSVSSHQSELLSLLNSPKVGAAQPSAPPASQPQTASGHKNSLLSALKSPLAPKPVQTVAHPPVPTKGSTSQLGTATATSTHKDSLLARLKSPVVPKAVPAATPSAQASPSSTVAAAQPSSMQMHKDALLSVLKSPTLPKEQPQTHVSVAPPPVANAEEVKLEQPTPAKLHQNALLSALKGSTSQPTEPPKSAPAQASHQASLLAALKSPTMPKATPSPIITSNSQTPSQAIAEKPPIPVEAIYSPSRRTSIVSPTVPQGPPSPEHRASLLSALKSPTSPTMSSFELSKSRGDPASLVWAALKNPTRKNGVDVKKGTVSEDGKGAKSVHVEALLKTLKTPSSSPTVEKATPVPVMESQAKGQIKDAVSPTTETNSTSQPLSNQMESLLATLKGAKSPPPTPKPLAPAQSSLLSILKAPLGGKKASQSPIVNQPTDVAPVTTVPTQVSQTHLSSKPFSTSSLLETLKGKPSRTSRSPSRSQSPNTTAPTTQKKPAISSEPSSKKSTPARVASPAQQSVATQSDFSPARQVGKRMKFRQILTPTGAKAVDSEPLTGLKPSGDIDLSKVTLLKRPAAPEESVSMEKPVVEKSEAVEESVEQQEGTPAIPISQEVGTNDNIESPLGIEYPFRRRNTKSASTSPQPTTPKAHTQSLLALLKTPPTAQAEITKEAKKENPIKRDPKVEEPSKEDKVQSLLRAFRSTINDEPTPKPIEETKPAYEEPIQQQEKDETKVEEPVKSKRELKLLAMLERALAKGV